MWYNNYQPYYPPSGAMPDNLSQMRSQQMQMPMPMQMPMQPQQTSGLIFVLGEESAKSYPVAPNNTVTLWDKESHTIYVKSVDASGVPSMQILDWTERTNKAAAPSFDASKFITREEFEKVIASLKGEQNNAE